MAFLWGYKCIESVKALSQGVKKNKMEKTKNTITEYIFEVGENNNTHKREIKKAEAVLFKFKLGGFNIALTKGFWKDGKTIYNEKSFKISYLDFDNSMTTEKARRIKEELKQELRQEEILLTATTKEIL